MKKILIIYPHFPPSNLAGVHRPRLFAQHLPEFGWTPVILTVHEKYYEENLDWNLAKLLPAELRLEKTTALPVTRPRIFGDIGIRAFFQLYKKAKKMIRKEQFDFLFIPVPSYYTALLGRWLHSSTGIPYGIDYVDPWVHEFPGSNKLFSRHWFSTKLAKLLEPIAVKKASLITGVAEGYYDPVFQRNPHLYEKAISGAMPYGGERLDNERAAQMDFAPYLFAKEGGKIKLVYAGAMLPKAYGPLEMIFRAIIQGETIFKNVEFHFIGTGKTPNDPEGFNIKPLAEKYGLWQKHVFEYPKRISYFDVLVHLEAADAVFILGSTEPHYTPSKIYQGVLSGKPIAAVLHSKSTGVNIIRQSGAGLVFDFEGENDLQKIEKGFTAFFKSFTGFCSEFDKKNVDSELFEKFSARSVTQQLVILLNKIIP